MDEDPTAWEILDAMPVGQTITISGDDNSSFNKAISEHHQSLSGGLFKRKHRTWFFREIIDIKRTL